ncbi:MAG: hypothetical protein HYZ27_02600, partial [Deltaproteobacteria bacterium]|nr:hypothetical protein [Deltaproteobacteria bacterium]
MDLVKLEARELAPEAAERLSAHVHGCSDCSAVVAELGEARQTLFRLAEPVAASARILAAAESPSPRPRLALGLGLAASCLLALVVVTTSSPDPYSATKGGRSLDPRPPSSERASLELFTKTQAGISKADDGVELVEGDAIQLRYHSGPHRYLLVISIDGSHKVTPLYPPALDGVSLPIARGMGT